MLGLAWLGPVLAGCAVAPNIEDEERTRAAAALALFDEPRAAETWYGVYQDGRRIGSMQVIREHTAAHLQFTTTVRREDGRVAADLAPIQTLIERFELAPPHEALLIEKRSGDDAYEALARIEHTPEGYVALRRLDGNSHSEPLFDFRYRLADRMAPQIWLRAAPENGACLSYPTFDLDAMGRAWVTECIDRRITHSVDGRAVKAIDLVYALNGARIRMVRDRTGRLLLGRFGDAFQLRLEGRNIRAALPPHRAPALAALGR